MLYGQRFVEEIVARGGERHAGGGKMRRGVLCAMLRESTWRGSARCQVMLFRGKTPRARCDSCITRSLRVTGIVRACGASSLIDKLLTPN